MVLKGFSEFDCIIYKVCNVNLKVSIVFSLIALIFHNKLFAKYIIKVLRFTFFKFSVIHYK